MLYAIVIVSCMQSIGVCHVSIVDTGLHANECDAKIDALADAYEAEGHPLDGIGCFGTELVRRWFERHEV